MDEKQQFLAAIRSSLGFAEMDARSVEECLELFTPPEDSDLLERIRYRTHVEKQALLQQLQDNAEQLLLNTHVVSSTDGAGDVIVEIVRSTQPEFSGIKQIVQHEHTELERLGLWKKLGGEPVQIHTCYSADQQIREKTIASYIGLTVPRWIVADSATAVELTLSGRPRSTSLLPSIHIGVVQLRHIVADLGELYAALREEKHTGSFTFITGPSKTADIEAHMVHGAHGPREMHLVIIDEKLTESLPLKGSGLFAP